MTLFFTIIIILFLGPVIGSLIGIWRKPSDRFMFNMLSFAAGVMLAVSFLELIPESLDIAPVWLVILGVASGAIIMSIFDKLIPHIHPELCSQEHGRNLKRTALYLLVGIFLHNFPEGIAIGAGIITDIKLTITVAIAIAIHDIPEAICTSAPYYFVSKKRMKAFLLSVSTVIPTILGFLLAYYLLQFIPLALIGFVIASTAGLMIYISADEYIS